MDNEKDTYYPQKEEISYIKNIFVIMIIPIILFLLELWVENGSTNFYNNYIGKFVMYKLPILGVPVLGVIFFGSLFYLYSKLVNQKIKTELNYQKKVNNYYLEQLEDEAKIMWRNHKKIMGIKDREILKQVIKNHVLRNKYIYGIQLYEYTIKVKFEYTTVKINYKDGYIDENININAMVQNYFKITTNLYNEFNDMVLNLKEIDNIDTKINKTKQFIDKNIKTLENKSPENYNYEDANTYAIILLFLQLLFSDTPNNNEYEEISILNNNKEEYLKNNFRTGIFRGILNDSGYLFKHESKSSNKNNRFYVSIPLEFQKQKCIFIITFNNELLSLKEGEEEVIEICNEIIKELEKELEKKYNDIKETF